MTDLSFDDDRPQRKHHGDVLLQVEEVLADEGAVVGFDVRSGEAFKVHLASADELAKHFVSPRDANRPFEERLNSALKRLEQRPSIIHDPDDDTTLHVEVGSVVKFENTRTFLTPDGEEKTASTWAASLVRDPLKEALIVGSVQANYFETKQKLGNGGETVQPRMNLTVVREQDAAPLKGFDLEAAFSGEWNDLPLNQTGVVISMRNAKGETTVSNLTTGRRKNYVGMAEVDDDGEVVRMVEEGEDLKDDVAYTRIYETINPTVESALDAPQGSYQIYAAAVVAAVTGARTFDDLKINEQVSPKKVENARKIYDHLVANPDSNALEIAVMPMANTQFIPAKALTNFLKEYHGTKNGKPSETVSPDPAVSYQGKGFVPSQIAMSRHNTDPENTPASARLLSPQNKFSFREIEVPRKIKDLGEESVVRIYGETYGANGPQAQADVDQEQSKGRKKAFDAAPGR